jgi:putative colanic acid biosynthesis UDP-glucose lipid carrier transferase
MTILKILASSSFSRYYKLSFLLIDVLIINTVIFISFWFRFGYFFKTYYTHDREISLLSNLLWIMLLLYKDSYRIIRTERIEAIITRTLKMLLIHISIVAVFITILKFDDISRLRMAYFYITFFVFLVSFRIIFMELLKYARAQGYNFRKVVIVGANTMGERMNRILSKDLAYGYKVLGFFDDDTITTTSKTSILGTINEVEAYLCNEKVDEMYVALHIDEIDVINKLTLLCERHLVRIRYIPDFQLYTKTNRVQVSFYGNGNIPVLMLRKEPLELTFNRLLKKLFDFCFALCIIVFLLSWLFPIIIIIIKMNSKGPVFFFQKRSGRDNKSFSCAKFRTMYVNDKANEVQATKNDSRITKVGAFLRRTSLDELPQFFNVLFGQMSVVGPRPHMLSHTEQYANLIDNFLVRHFAKPGITGWAQVNGFRGETKELIDMEGRVEYDIWYIENWSFVLDIKIIILTVLNVFKGEKNAF